MSEPSVKLITVEDGRFIWSLKPEKHSVALKEFTDLGSVIKSVCSLQRDNKQGQSWADQESRAQ